MTYPNYDKLQLDLAEKDGEFEISDFASFINQLLSFNLLEHPAEIGVANFIKVNGTNNLPEEQAKVLKIIVDKFGSLECKNCYIKIKWSELPDAHDNGGYCSYCSNR